MAELTKKLRLTKHGTHETAALYSSASEVGDVYADIIVDGEQCYVALGSTDDELRTSGRVMKNGITYAIKKEAIRIATVNLICKDVKTSNVLTTVKYTAIGELYLNNENAPNISGYDFARLEGIKYKDFHDEDDFVVWYVENTVPDRTKTDWSYFGSAYDPETDDFDIFKEFPPYINTYSATNMESMFEEYGDGADWVIFNTSNVTNMNSMFIYSSTRIILDMDTTNVIDMGYMFEGCDLDAKDWNLDTSNVINMMNIFANARFTDGVAPEMETSNVVEMTGMFDASNIKTIPAYNTSKVESMAGMFHWCEELTEIPSLDTSNVVYMESMFASCERLAYVPPLDTSKVETMYAMFYDCSSLKSLDWEIDMSSCTDCDYMFIGCPATNIRLKNVPRNLDLSEIGTTNYTVVNYID